MYKKGRFKHYVWHKTFSMGNMQKRLWFRIVVTNKSLNNNNYIISIHNFLDSAVLYLQKNDTLKKIAADTYWNIASNRIIKSRPLGLPFSVSTNDTIVLYFSITQFNYNFYFPIHIQSMVEFFQQEQNFIFEEHWFWFIGFYIFSALYALILFSFLKQKIYFLYFIYILFNTIFLFMEDDLDVLFFSQSFYTLINRFGQYSFLLLSTAASNKIFNSFVGVYKKNNIIRQVGNWLIILSLILVLFTFFYQCLITHRLNLWIISLIKIARDVLIILNLFYILFSLAAAWLYKIEWAKYYFLTYIFFFLSSILIMSNHLGISSFNLLSPNVFTWGLVIELFLLTIILTIRFKNILQNNELLKLKNIEIQKMQTKRMIDVQETERKRIAQDLHDDLGSSLAALKLQMQNSNIDTIKLSNLIQVVDKASADARNISHNLMPPEFEKTDLFELLKAYYNKLNSESTIHFNFFCSDNKKLFTKENELIIYRILMELTTNIIKHSNANEANIHLLYFADYLLIMNEDNGQGISLINNEGIGIKNIRARVTFLNGTFKIDSSSVGTTSIINIPFK